MTIEDKAQAYDEVLNKLRHFIAQGVDPLITRADVQDFFPGLVVKSEDEKIRKELIDYINRLTASPNNIDKYNTWIAWLEKQGEQKNKITFEDVLVLECAMKTVKITEGGNELYEMLVRLYNKIHNAYLLEKQGEQNFSVEMKTPEESLGVDSDTYSKIVDECIYGEQKPAWSEEDECYMSECINAIATKDGWSFEEKRKTKHWLKSLKQRVGG